jgi:hypothetical protein
MVATSCQLVGFKHRQAGSLSLRISTVEGDLWVVEQTAVIGIRAPEFSVVCTSGREAERRRVSLADYQGRWLMLVFYPRDFSLV